VHALARRAQFRAPDGQGNFNNSQIESITRDDPQPRNASEDCDSLLPNEGTGLSVTELQDIQQQNLRNAVKAARCMRARGIENFPDPAGSTQDSGVNWAPVQSALQADQINPNTPSYEAAYDACSGKRVGGPIPPNFAPGFVAAPPPRGSGSGLQSG
jgi:hypothetical protein